LEESKKSKGKNFMKDNVCKAYMLGFCPLSELSESKMAGKRHIRACEKAHSDAMKAEFLDHPDKDKYQADYEKELLPVLDKLAREADAWVAREKANVEKVAGTTETVTKNTMTDAQKEQYEQLKEDMNKMMAAAETEAEKGNFDGSKFKVMLADEVKAKITELEEKHISTFEVTQRGEDVCEICGTRYEALTATNHARHAAHFQGKVHIGYVKIREWIKTLNEKHNKSSKRPDKDDDDGKRERRRSRSRREREKPRATSRERERRRSRSRKDRRGGSREPGRDRYRQRSRSRGDRRGRGRG
jgi:hypothetical protein